MPRRFRTSQQRRKFGYAFVVIGLFMLLDATATVLLRIFPSNAYGNGWVVLQAAIGTLVVVAGVTELAELSRQTERATPASDSEKI
jgi:hypothetical protein